jgi:CHASE3 domain sensor protein
MSLAPRTPGSFFIRYATAIAIATVTLLMILATLSFWRQEQASAAAKSWLVHTYEVIEHLESLRTKLEDAETAQRAYLLTGSDEYLEPYEDALREGHASKADRSAHQGRASDSPHEARTDDPVLGSFVINNALQQHRSIHQELAYIRSLTADNPVQQSNLDEMDDVTGKLLDYLSATIKEKKGLGTTSVGASPDIHREKQRMDHARNMLSIMESEESHLLALRTEGAQFFFTLPQEAKRLL